jgi:hypothetical protein
MIYELMVEIAKRWPVRKYVGDRLDDWLRKRRTSKASQIMKSFGRGRLEEWDISGDTDIPIGWLHLEHADGASDLPLMPGEENLVITSSTKFCSR